jgi:hypothetical protein
MSKLRLVIVLVAAALALGAGGVLSAQAINIVEALSCYTDTIFLLEQDDLSAAISVLTKTLR